jgi:DNA-binding MarR family transcriptional regulator
VSVASVVFKLLENKNYISRQIESDNRKKIVKMLIKGKNLFEDISPLIKKEEQLIFEKLKNETFNFTNSLKLLLGKKIRIQAKQ